MSKQQFPADDDRSAELHEDCRGRVEALGGCGGEHPEEKRKTCNSIPMSHPDPTSPKSLFDLKVGECSTVNCRTKR